MRRLTSGDREFDFPAHDPARRAEAIAAMGYRLAAAGPRTRQRLLDRGPVQEIPVESPVVWLAPGIIGDDAAQAWPDEEGEPGLARLSAEQPVFPVWRAAALAVSAACGFALVLYAQGLHLDRRAQRQAARETKPVVVAQAQGGQAQAAPTPPIAAQQVSSSLARQPTAPPEVSATPAVQLPAPAKPQPDTPEAAAPSTAAPAAAQTAASQAAPVPPPAAVPAAGSIAAKPTSIAQQPILAEAGQAEPEPAPRAAARAVQPQVAARQHAPPPAPQLFAALPRPASRRAILHPLFAMVDRQAAPKAAEPKPRAPVRTASVHYDLPHWLTEYRPAPAPQHVLVMSPPPHNLDDDAPAKPAPVALPAPPPKTTPAQRPALIYAEAHYPPPARPYYAAPYYAPSYYPPGYGYYAPASPYGQQ